MTGFTTWFYCPHHVDEAVAFDGDGCPQCLAWFAAPPDPVTMTPEEREAEMERHGGTLTVPFDVVHRRVEQLLGRTVQAFEFADLPRLRREARERPARELSDREQVQRLAERVGGRRVVVREVEQPDNPS